MLPVYEEDRLGGDLGREKRPSLTWKLEGGRVAGLCDGAEALKQAVELILSTERFAYAIYSHRYGIELADLYGLNPALTRARLQGRVEEALLADGRITGIGQFTLSPVKGGGEARFTVNSRFGPVEAGGEFFPGREARQGFEPAAG